MKTLDISRLMKFDPEKQRIGLNADGRKKIRGVSTHPVSMFVETSTSENTLYDVQPAGQFAFEINSPDEAIITFNVPKGAIMSILTEAKPLVMEGDVDGKWTVVNHRPAINPEMREVMSQMREMQHAVGILGRENERIRRAKLETDARTQERVVAAREAAVAEATKAAEDAKAAKAEEEAAAKDAEAAAAAAAAAKAAEAAGAE